MNQADTRGIGGGKGTRKRVSDPEYEERKRQKHVQSVTALGEEDASVHFLEGLVFGAEEELLEKLVGDEGYEDEGANLLLEDDVSSDEDVENEARVQPARRAVWQDDDDEQEEQVDMTHRFRKDLMKGEAEAKMSKQKLEQRMKEQFKKAMGGTPSWAETKTKKSKKRAEEDDDEEEDDDDDLLRKTGNFVGSSESLPKGIIRMKKCLNANNANPSEDRLTTVQFHPSAQVVMTAGLDRSISLFQVDGKTNPKIQSIHLDKFPVHKARFSMNGEQVVATGTRSRLFYIYDMMEGSVIPIPGVRGLKEPKVKDFEVSPDGDSLLLTGTSGYLHVLTMKSREVVRSMKINGNVCGAAYSTDGSKVFANSEEGEVYIWDARSSKCLNKFTDDGCVTGTSLAASPNGQYLACGSKAGVVNIYSQEACMKDINPKPLKAVMNLLTAATSLCFNPTTEILAIASHSEDEATRLVHLPSFTVFSNFPVQGRKGVYRTQCVHFSPNSGFFSLGNNKGKAPLFRLLHYKDF